MNLSSSIDRKVRKTVRPKRSAMSKRTNSVARDHAGWIIAIIAYAIFGCLFYVQSGLVVSLAIIVTVGITGGMFLGIAFLIDRFGIIPPKKIEQSEPTEAEVTYWLRCDRRRYIEYRNSVLERNPTT